MNVKTLGVAAALMVAGVAFAQGAAPSPAPAAAPAPVAAPAAPKPLTADEAFQTRVKTLEEQVTDLKEKILRTKSRLALLQETVLGGDLSMGARAVIYHRNEMGGAFVLETISYVLDGAPIKTIVDTTGDLNKQEEFEVFNGRIVPGNHTLNVRMVYRGSGFGIFSYLEGYKFKLQSNQTFNAEAGKVTEVKVVGFEKGGITADIKDKPGIRYDITTTKDARGGTTPPPAPEGAPAQ